LSPDGDNWNKSILYAFSDLPPYGEGSPSGFALDASGDLYGVTNVGGSACNLPGCGVVYELSPPTSGMQWRHKVLYQFQGAEDGSYPVGNVLLYNNQIYGTVFSVAP
jgi:hypothetical protein